MRLACSEHSFRLRGCPENDTMLLHEKCTCIISVHGCSDVGASEQFFIIYNPSNCFFFASNSSCVITPSSSNFLNLSISSAELMAAEELSDKRSLI